MKKKGHTPITRVKNPEPEVNDPDWIVWAAWADRITFEEIEKKTGKTESEVIKIMRRSVKPASFRLWRKRVNQKSIKHREIPATRHGCDDDAVRWQNESRHRPPASVREE